MQSTGDDVHENTDDVIVPIEHNVVSDDSIPHRSIRPPLWHKDFVMANKKGVANILYQML